jgi:hypothetical protein
VALDKLKGEWNTTQERHNLAQLQLGENKQRLTLLAAEMQRKETYHSKLSHLQEQIKDEVKSVRLSFNIVGSVTFAVIEE